MPQKVKNRITSQLHACLHVSLLSPINPLCSTTPLLPPPYLLLPSPLLLSLLLTLLLSSLHSLSSLLLLRAVLVLAPADGAAWVRAALVRDLFCAPADPAAHLLAAGML